MSHEDIRAKLAARREELLGQIAKIEADIQHRSQPVERDSEERSIQRENDEVLDALDDAGRRELGDIAAALERIDAGTFGTCASCGSGIAPARLAALPTAATCIRCAEQER